MYSCILIHGKIAAATESWWTLNSDEIKLLSLLATTENSGASKDIPVYLPYKSPTVRIYIFNSWIVQYRWMLCTATSS